MGTGLGKMMLGGALAGGGDSLIKRAEHKRTLAIQMIEEQSRASREASNREFQSGLLSGTEVGEDGNVYGITRAGEKRDLGFKGRKSGTQMREERLYGEGEDGTAASGMSAGDKRIIDAVVKRNTTGYLDEEEVDWTAVDKTLRDQGRDDLADFLKDQDTGPAVDIEGPEYKEAKKRAQALAKERTGLLSSRDAEFPETEGSMESFIQQKTDEIYQQMTGQQAPSASGQDKSAAPEAQAPGQPEGDMKAPGSGTEQDPYKPTSQAQFDSIPSGRIYINPADGKPYRKN